jgi:p24 family protein beta-1
MLLSKTAVCAALAGWVGTTLAHNIALKAHTRECFHEELHREDKMTVTFQVGDREFGGAGNLDIDFYVRPCHLNPKKSPVTDAICRSPTLQAHTKNN